MTRKLTAVERLDAAVAARTRTTWRRYRRALRALLVERADAARSMADLGFTQGRTQPDQTMATWHREKILAGIRAAVLKGPRP